MKNVQTNLFFNIRHGPVGRVRRSLVHDHHQVPFLVMLQHLSEEVDHFLGTDSFLVQLKMSRPDPLIAEIAQPLPACPLPFDEASIHEETTSFPKMQSTTRSPRPENTAKPCVSSRFCGFSGPQSPSTPHELPRPFQNTAAPAFDRSSQHPANVAKWCHEKSWSHIPPVQLWPVAKVLQHGIDTAGLIVV